MLNTASILGELSNILSDMLDHEVVLTADMKPTDIEGWDSLFQMSLLVIIEENYGIKFPIKQMGQFETVGALAEIICKAGEK